MYRHYRSGTMWASLALTVAVVVAAPQSPESAAAAAAAATVSSADDVVYDQRQNGTENVRISLSDLKVVLAPADGLFQIMSMAGAQLLNSELANTDMQRPTAFECTGLKCNNRHRQTAKTNRFKLSSIIAPLLQQNNNQAAEQKQAAGAAESNSNSINK